MAKRSATALAGLVFALVATVLVATPAQAANTGGCTKATGNGGVVASVCVGRPASGQITADYYIDAPGTCSYTLQALYKSQYSGGPWTRVAQPQGGCVKGRHCCVYYVGYNPGYYYKSTLQIFDRNGARIYFRESPKLFTA